MEAIVVAAADTVTLKVGDRIFVTLRNTLKGSAFLSIATSGRWPIQPDGSYFLDSDPELFGHILTFLRRGTFPLLWDPRNGHDFAKYNQLLQEALFLGIDELAVWLNAKKYMKAITMKQTWVPITDGAERTVDFKDELEVCAKTLAVKV